MARGTNTAGDLLTRISDGTSLNDLWKDHQAAIAEHNAKRDTITQLLSFKTTLAHESVMQSYTGSEFEEASEFGQPVGIRPGLDYAKLGYQFLWRDVAKRFTFMFLADASREQVDAVTNAVLEADNKQVFRASMAALFSNVARLNKEGDNVYPLWSADGMVPPDSDDATFDGTHNHYVTTNSATLTAVHVEALMSLVLEHGYGDPGRGSRLLLLVNRQEGNIVRGFRSVAGGGAGSYDFIPGESAPARLASETVVGDTPPAAFGDQPLIGSYGPALVGENSLIPKGYVLALASGGANSPFNAVAFREHPTRELRGLRLAGGENSEYPLLNSFSQRGFGTGIRHRGAAAVLQVVNSATYTVPSQFAGVR